MRIGLINEFFTPFAPGGAEWSMFELGKALVGSGHQVAVITPNYGAEGESVESGMHVLRFPFPKKLKTGRKMPGFLWHANLLFYFYSAWQIFIIAKKERLEILHCQNKYSLPGSFLAARLLGIPVVCSIRDTSNICRIAVCLHHHEAAPKDCGTWKLLKECSEEYYDRYYEKKSLWLHAKDKIWQVYHWWDVHLRRSCLNRVDLIVGVSQGILNVHEKSRIFLRSKAKRRAIYNFVNQDLNHQAPESNSLRKKYGVIKSKIVLYVGGFSIGKGTSNFAQAASLVSKKNKNVSFILIGSGKLQESNGDVQIISDVSHEDVLQFYKLADVVVVPSICQESLSRVILEAMAAGRPVVGTQVGGTSEAISDGENGYVVERRDTEALANAIEKILSDGLLAKKMGQKSLEIVKQKFSKEAVISQFENLYSSLIKKGG